MVLVFHFRLGQRCLVVNTPIGRAQTFVDESVFEELIERFQNHRFVLRRHGRIGLVELAKNSQALKLRTLQIEELGCIFAASVADSQRLHLQLFAAQHLIHFDFNGQAVAVPTGNIGRVETGHGLRLNDEILKALVQRVAEVNRPVGIRRTVMQHIRRLPLACLANPLVNPHRRPALEQRGLVFRQVRLHGKVGLGQV